MSLWWDHDKSDKDKGLRCKHCVTHPELIQTGNSDPMSLKCPVCKATFSSDGVIYDEKEYNAQLRFELEENIEDAWNATWRKP